MAYGSVAWSEWLVLSPVLLTSHLQPRNGGIIDIIRNNFLANVSKTIFSIIFVNSLNTFDYENKAKSYFNTNILTYVV